MSLFLRALVLIRFSLVFEKKWQHLLWKFSLNTLSVIRQNSLNLVCALIGGIVINFPSHRDGTEILRKTQEPQ
jgi:hypothetical protein